ncbi:MAG: mannan-binding lectin [Gammaproteobacteria bacterium]|jgi:hypothetical protein
MYKKLLFLVLLVLVSWLLIDVAVAQFNLPPGNYQDSCDGCSVINGRLDCFCKDQRGFPHHTSIMVKRGVGIMNNNGQLQYMHRHHRHWHPHKRGILRDIEAGPIWSQMDAENTCPDICHHAGGEWTGQWNTTKWTRQSVCQCKFGRYY